MIFHHSMSLFLFHVAGVSVCVCLSACLDCLRCCTRNGLIAQDRNDPTSCKLFVWADEADGASADRCSGRIAGRGAREQVIHIPESVAPTGLLCSLPSAFSLVQCSFLQSLPPCRSDSLTAYCIAHILLLPPFSSLRPEVPQQCWKKQRRTERRCFNCGQEGHWSSNCPNRREGGR
jgi:hypothetical protein